MTAWRRALPPLLVRGHRAGWPRLVALCLVCLALAGCTLLAPGYIKCSGKGTITMSAPMGTGTLHAECSGGGPFVFEQRKEAPK